MKDETIKCNGDTRGRPGFRQNRSGFRDVMAERPMRHLNTDLSSE